MEMALFFDQKIKYHIVIINFTGNVSSREVSFQEMDQHRCYFYCLSFLAGRASGEPCSRTGGAFSEVLNGCGLIVCLLSMKMEVEGPKQSQD